MTTAAAPLPSAQARRWQLIAIMALFALCGALFLYLVGRDALAERNTFQFFADSNTYHRIYSGEQWLANDALLSVSDNYLGPLLVLRALGGNEYLVMLLNVTLFYYSVVRIAALLSLDPVRVALLLLVSPLTISSLLSVNKEIFVLPFVACALAAYVRRSPAMLLVALGVSVLIRWQMSAFFLALVGIELVPPLRRRRLLALTLLLLALSAVYLQLHELFAPVLDVVARSILDDPDQGSGTFARLLDWQDRGFYWVVFPLKAMHLLFAKGLRVTQAFNPTGVYNDVFVGLHSTATIVVFLRLLRGRRFTLRSDLVFASVVFLAVFCISPVYAPRYLYPAYVAWVLVLAGARDALRPGGAADRSVRKRQSPPPAAAPLPTLAAASAEFRGG